MDSNNLGEKKEYIYPKNLLNTKTNRKRLNHNIQNCVDNPLISRITRDSFFIFDQNDFIKYYKNLKNKNLLKPSKDDILVLKNIVSDLSVKNNTLKGKEFISLDEDIFNKINNFKAEPKHCSEIISFIKAKIEESKNRTNISCKKLSKEYYIKTGKYVGKSTIHNILKIDLGLRYLKTIPKNNFLQREQGILDCLCYIKTFIKCVKLGFQPLFLDESKIEIMNNHYRCWREKSETIYFGDAIKNKKNLILAVGQDEAIHYKLTEENTNTEVFLQFLKELKVQMDKKKNNQYFIIMDNLPTHKDTRIIQYLDESKMNVLFNVPYYSQFNSIELTFKALKRKIYSHLYESFEQVDKEINNFLEDKAIKITLLGNYIETLNQYITYIEKNNYININGFKIIE